MNYFRILSLSLLFGLVGMLTMSCEEERVCHVHDEAMVDKEVAIAYGMPMFFYDYKFSYEFRAARDTAFPNEFLRNHVEGGCVVQDEEEMEVKCCHSCNEAYRTWIADNGELVSFWEDLEDSVGSVQSMLADQQYEAWQEQRRLAATDTAQ